MEEYVKAFIEYIVNNPIWFFLIAIIYLTGTIALIAMYNLKVGKIKKWKVIQIFALGASFTAIVFLILNFRLFVNASITLKIVEERLLSAALISLALMGVMLLISYVWPNISKKCKTKKKEKRNDK